MNVITMFIGNKYLNIVILHMYPAGTKHLYNISTMSAQRLRRWSDIVQMLYKCFVFASLGKAQ